MFMDADIYDFLEHHGVKGQKWGVVNKGRLSGLKTKLADIRQTQRNKSSQIHVNKANELQKQIDVLKSKQKTATTDFQRTVLNGRVNELSQKKTTEDKAAEARKQGHLTDKEKKVAIGVGVAAAVVAVYGGHQFIQSGNANRAMIKGKMLVEGKSGLPWKVSPYLATKDFSSDQIMKNVVKDINPDFGELGTKVNCRRCTFAYEMRRRGFDVAATKTSTGRGQDVTGIVNAISPGKNNVPAGASGILTRMYSEAIRKTVNSDAETPFTDLLTTRGATAGLGEHVVERVTGRGVSNDIYAALAQHPEGARGELGLTWQGGGGHSVAWEIIGGKPVIFDTQSGKKYESSLALDAAFGGNTGIAEAGYTRLDDKPLNDDFLMRWLKDA
jgi:hypothetical protein